jgi:hypothetical protein
VITKVTQLRTHLFGMSWRAARVNTYAPPPLTPALVLQAVTDWDIPAFGVR